MAGTEASAGPTGADRVLKNKPQATSVSSSDGAADGRRRSATEAFAERARREFTGGTTLWKRTQQRYFWDVRDLDSADAPHVPIALPYEPRLADFRDIAEIADYLCEREYAAIAERIGSHFEQEPQ